jgi:hypothetical protein
VIYCSESFPTKWAGRRIIELSEASKKRHTISFHHATAARDILVAKDVTTRYRVRSLRIVSKGIMVETYVTG